MRMMMSAAILGIVLASPLAAQSRDEAALLARARTRGALIYAYDQAAWHGTDDMLAKLPHPEQRVGGYIVDGPADAPRIVFYDKGATKAVYVAQFADGRITAARMPADGEDASLSPIDLRMIAALVTARRAMVADGTAFTCTTKTFNTVVLPPQSPDEAVSVYFLTPQTTEDAIPFGGHFEVDVDTAGHAGAVRPFSKSCITAPTHPALPKGANPSMFVITSALDTVPTEIHVFSSLALHMPVGMVVAGTPPRVWPIAGTTIGTPVAIKR